MSIITAPRQAAPDDMPPPDDPYRYGWRDVIHEQTDGTYWRERIPLTRLDVLHPQMGDCIVEGSLNFDIRAYLYGVFCARLAHVSGAVVLSDTGVYWDNPELGHHAPDVCAIFGVKRKLKGWQSFHVAREGTRPRVIVEIVSPHVRSNDVVDKFAAYHAAGVHCYIIVDHSKPNEPWQLKGYLHTPAGYEPMPTDERGRLWLPDLNIWLGVGGLRVVCYDGQTGTEIADYVEQTQRLQEQEAQVYAEKARADSALADADAAKARADSAQVAAAAEKARAAAEKARADAAEARLRQLEEEIARRRNHGDAS